MKLIYETNKFMKLNYNLLHTIKLNEIIKISNSKQAKFHYSTRMTCNYTQQTNT